VVNTSHDPIFNTVLQSQPQKPTASSTKLVIKEKAQVPPAAEANIIENTGLGNQNW